MRRGHVPASADSLVVAVLTLVGLRLGLSPLSDNSAFTHLATGIRMVADGLVPEIPRVDPYTFTAPVGLGEGSHTVIVRAYNLAEISADHQVGINLEPPCESADSCGDGNVCMGGQCLPGPDQSGGLGSRCQETVECFTGFCDTPNGAEGS